MAAPKKATNLERLYPSAVISDGGDTRIIMKPLPIRQLPKVIDLLTSFALMREEGKNDFEIVKIVLTDILAVVESCVDISLDDIPATLAPDIALCFIKQNFNEEVQGKWQNLGVQVAALFPGKTS